MPLVSGGPDNYDALLSTTLAIYEPRLEDNFYNALPFWHMLNRRGAVKMYDGGESFNVGVLYADNTTATRLVTGYDQVSVTPQDAVTSAVYVPRHYACSITISLAEELANSGRARAIDLLQEKTEHAEIAIRNLLDGDVLSDSSARPGSVEGLQFLIQNAAAASQTNAPGGISKATFAFWRNQRGAVTAFSVDGRSTMTNIYNSCSGGSSDHPEFVICDQASYENYQRILEPIERVTPLGERAGAVGDPQFEALKFRGALVFFDSAAPTGLMYFLNSRYIYLRVHERNHFRVSPFVKFPNQLARTAQITWTGNTIVSNMRRLGVVSGANTF